MCVEGWFGSDCCKLACVFKVWMVVRAPLEGGFWIGSPTIRRMGEGGYESRREVQERASSAYCWRVQYLMVSQLFAQHSSNAFIQVMRRKI